MVSVMVVSITVLLTTAAFSTTIVFSFTTTFSLITLSSVMDSSSGAASLIPIMGILITGILTIHTTLTVVINHVVKIST